MSSPKFERFPLDGRLYRLISCGRVQQASIDMETPCVQACLVQMDEPKSGDPTYARHSDGAAKLILLDEAAGSIPTLIMGSLWRDRTIQPDYSLPQSISVQDAVLPAQEWRLTTLGAVTAAGVNRQADSLPTWGQDDAGRHIALGEMPVLHGHTDTGLNLFIPCYEIFRRFFGLTTELANAFLSRHWMREIGCMVNLKTTQLTKEGVFEIEPAIHLSNVACRAIALFLTSSHARIQASQIYVSIDNDRRAKVQTPWIKAMPSWGAEPMQLSFIGERLSDQSVLVLWIHDSQFPRVAHPITRLTDQAVLKSSPEAPSGPTSPPHTDVPEEGEMPTIGRPQDARPSGKALHISILDTWSRLPELRRRVISLRTIPQDPDKPPRDRPPAKKRLATGKRNASGRRSAASLSSDDEAQIRDRFHALAMCFELMVRKGQLASFSDYAVASPVETPTATYCALPIEIGGITRPWAIVDGRARLCWAIELIRTDRRRFYWFEIESKGPKGHRALLLHMNSDAVLSASAVDRLLKTVVLGRGGWKVEQLAFSERNFTACTVTHRFEDGKVKPTLILGKMIELTGQAKGPMAEE